MLCGLFLSETANPNVLSMQTAQATSGRFVDFKQVKAQVSILQVLEHYHLIDTFKKLYVASEPSICGKARRLVCKLCGEEGHTTLSIKKLTPFLSSLFMVLKTKKKPERNNAFDTPFTIMR